MTVRVYLWSTLTVLIMACGNGATSTNDTETDTQPDADGGVEDGGDTGPVTLWPWCPPAASYQGNDSWPWSVEVTRDAVYCGAVPEADINDPDASLKSSRDQKVQLRFVPGAYPLPAPEASDQPLSLPICFDNGSGVSPYSIDESGEVSVASDDIYVWWPDGRDETLETRHIYTYSQPIQNGANDETLVVQLEGVNYHPDAPMTMRLDGRYRQYYLNEDAPTFNRIAIYSDGNGPPFYPCRFFDRPEGERLTDVTFQGGEIHFDMDIYADLPEGNSTEPSAFVRAFGIFKGISFDQTDYWKLIYAPAHHHFQQNWAVLFDSPIEGACGLKVTNYDKWDTTVVPSITAVDCDLNDIETLAI